MASLTDEGGNGSSDILRVSLATGSVIQGRFVTVDPISKALIIRK